MIFRRRSMSVRLSLALRYIAAMVAVLTLYAAVVRTRSSAGACQRRSTIACATIFSGRTRWPSSGLTAR